MLSLVWVTCLVCSPHQEAFPGDLARGGKCLGSQGPSPAKASWSLRGCKAALSSSVRAFSSQESLGLDVPRGSLEQLMPEADTGGRSPFSPCVHKGWEAPRMRVFSCTSLSFFQVSM